MLSGEQVSNVDVLIIGAGPAGLMLANWLSRFDVKTRIVDKRGTKLFNGQADGLASRTMEIFDSFDLAHRVFRESNHVLEKNLWGPDKNGILQRSSRNPVSPPNSSRFHLLALNQGRIERFLLDSIKEHSDIEVERGVLPESLDFDESKAEEDDAYPITVKLRHLSEEEATPKQSATSANGAGIQNGLHRSNITPDDTAELLEKSKLNSNANSVETIKAKYMVGADGAHSYVRNALGYELIGESTDYIWGVLDIIPITNFPDIRVACIIKSESSGTVLVVPRENKQVRLYIQLTTTENTGGGKVDRSKINPDVIMASAQMIMAPYKITYRYCDWWTAYQIGQRVGEKFSKSERIFLAGDAVHTHSPKAGQGMNVSMQDTYNLGWKLAQVLNGNCDRSLLKTYQSERRRVAQDLIDFDYRLSRQYSRRPAKDAMDEGGISMDEFKKAVENISSFSTGLGVDYGKSMIVAKAGDSQEQGDGTEVMSKDGTNAESKQDLATNIKLGMRMPSFKVLNQADSRPWHFQELLKSNGRWRLVIFSGDIKNPQQGEKIQKLGEKLNAPYSFLRRYTPSGKPIDSLIEVLSVHSTPRQTADMFAYPDIFHPFNETEGWDYWKVYVDDESYHEGHGQAYMNYGIDPEKGCAVILRPDQYVSWVGEVDDYEQMDKFFSAFMREQKQRNAVSVSPTGGALNGTSSGVDEAEKVLEPDVANDAANGTM